VGCLSDRADRVIIGDAGHWEGKRGGEERSRINASVCRVRMAPTLSR
jgi:hypothetical protein